jgi:hypothetical protein
MFSESNECRQKAGWAMDTHHAATRKMLQLYTDADHANDQRMAYLSLLNSQPVVS